MSIACGCCICCSTLIISTLLLFIVFMTLYAITGFPFANFHLNSAILSPFNMTRTSFLADCNMSILVTNSNEKKDGGLYLSSVEGRLKYGEDSYLVAKAPLPNFYQDKLSQTIMPVRFMASSNDDEDISSRILTDRVYRRVLRFDLEVLFLVKYNWKLVRILRQENYMMLAHCGKFMFEFPSESNDTSSYGTMIGGARQCEVTRATCYYCRPNCGKAC